MMNAYWDIADKAGVVIGLVGFLVTISIRLLLSRQQKNENTPIVFNLACGTQKYRIKPTILRKDVSRSEVFGFVASLPRKDATKRFSIGFLNSEQFWKSLADIQANKMAALEIICTREELAEFDLDQAIFCRQGTELKSKVYLVSRHPATATWMKENGYHYDFHLDHLDVGRINRGDTVIGTLPIQRVSQLSNKKIRYFHFSIDVPASKRGQELNYADLCGLNPRLENFLVYKGQEKLSPR